MQHCGTNIERPFSPEIRPNSTENCHFSTFLGTQFGYQVQGDDYMSLTNNTILRNNTTLLCITEQFNQQPVQWKYESLNGVSTDLPSTTDVRGFSTINVTLDQPSIYSCNVLKMPGMSS